MTPSRGLIPALLLCAGTLGAQSAGAVTIQDNLGATNGGNIFVSHAQYVAAKVTLPATAYTITDVTLNTRANNVSNPIQIQVCNDNGSGTAPGTTCSVFAGTNPTTAAFVNYTFSGSFTATASQAIWIVASVPAVGGAAGYFWSVSNSSPGNNNAYDTSHDQGTSWGAAGSNVALAVAGSVVVSAPIAAPTLDTWAKICMALLLAAGGAWMVRRRAGG